MQSLTVAERKKILARPGVTEADINEYEELSSERYATEPQGKPSIDAAEQRLAELYKKLFG